MAFLGLAVVTAPVAGAATDDSGSTGTNTDTGSGAESGSGASGSGSGSTAGVTAGSSGNASGGNDAAGDGSGTDGPGDAQPGGGDTGNPGSGDNAGDEPDNQADEASDGTQESSSSPTTPEPSVSSEPVDTTPTADPTPAVETTTAPQPEVTITTDPPTPTVEPQTSQPQDATAPAKTQEIAPAGEGTAKTMSLLAEPADVSSAAVVLDPYGLPDNPFNTTDPTRQQLNPIGQWVESIVPAYPKVDGFTPVSLAVMVVKFLNDAVGWTQQNGQDTIFTWPVYVLFAAAYQRLIDIGTNTLASVKVTGTSQTLGLVTVDLDVKNPDDAVYLPQLAGITGNGNTWVYEPITQTVVLTTLNPGMLLNGGDDTISFTVDDSLGYLDHPIGAQSVTVDIPVHINPVITVNGLPYFELGAAKVTGTDGDGVVHGTVVAIDPDGDSVTYSGSTLANTGDVEVDAEGNWTYTPSAAARHAAATLLGLKNDLVYITATDSKGGSSIIPASVTVDITPKNTNPTVSLGTGPSLNFLRTSYEGTLNSGDADNDLLYFSASGLPVVGITEKGGLVTVNPLNGAYTYTPAGSAWFNGGSDSFDITVDDLHGGTATVTVNIAGANQAPTFTTPATATITDSSTGTAKITAVAVDPEGGTVTYAAQADNGRGTVTANADGSWTFVASDAARHTAATTGLAGWLAPKTETITVTATDETGASKTSSVTVDLVPLNTNPTLTLGDGPALNFLRTSYTGTVNGTDPEDDSLSYSGTTITDKLGTVVVLGNTYTYTPAGSAWFNGGSDSFVVSVDDGHGGTASVTVNIAGANQAPTVAASATVTNSSTGTAKITAVASDPEGGPVTLSASVDSSLGSLTSNADGSWTFVASDAARHAAADTGLISGLFTPKSATITVTATDDKGASKSASVSVDLVPLNTNPTLTLGDGPALNFLRTSYTGTVNGADAEGDSLSYGGSTITSSGGTVVVLGNTYTYTPFGSAWFNGGSDSFDVTVDDGHGGTAKVTVVIAGANQAPTVAANATVTNSSTGTAKITAVASDPEGGPVTLSASVDSSLGSLTSNADGSWTFVASDAARHAAADTGLISGLFTPKSATITVTATDDKNVSKSASVSVDLVPLNTNPTLTLGSGPALNALHTSYVGTVNGADAEGDSLSYGGSTITSAGGTVVVLGNTYTYTPLGTAWFNGGSDSFDINVDDGHGGTATVNVVINGANKAPTFTTPATATVTNASTGTAKITAVAVDPDGDAVTYTAQADNGRGTVTANADGSWTFVASDAARHAAADTGLISGLFTPKTETITVTATDSYGASKNSSVTVDLVPLNTNPTLTLGSGPALNVLHTSYVGTVNGSDAEGDSLSYGGSTITSAGGTVVVLGNGYTYTPLGTAWLNGGSDSFVVTVDDGHGGTASVTVNIGVKKNEAPTFTTPATATITDSSTGTAKITAVATDPDGDAVTYTAKADNGRGTVTANADGSWTFVASDAARHAAADTGLISGLFTPKTETITVTATDSLGASKNSSVTVNLVPLNTDPTLTLGDGPALNFLHTSYVGTVNGSDADGDSLSYGGSTITSAGGTVTVLGNGYTYTPFGSAWLNGASDSFVVTVNDGHGGTAAVTVNIGVKKNVAPTFTQAATVISTNQSTGLVTGTSTATDADGDPVTYAASTANDRGTVTVAANGSWTFLPSDDARVAAASTLTGWLVNTEKVTITATDGKGGSTTSSVTVDVVPNHDPVFTQAAAAGSPDSSTGAVRITATATDSDGDVLTYVTSTDNGRGAVTRNPDGSWTFTPSDPARHTAATGSATTEKVTITVTDTRGASASSSVTVNILPKNTQPGATATTTITSTSPGDPETINGKIVGSDSDGDTLSYASGFFGYDTRSTAKGGSVTIYSNGNFTYTSGDGDTHAAALPTATAADKQDSFVVTITDGHGGSRDVTVNVNLDPYNRTPSASSSDSSTRDINYGLFHTYSNSTTYHVTISDGDSDSITYTGSSTTTKGTVTVAANTTLGDSILGLKGYDVTYTSHTTAKPNPTETFTVYFSDGHGGTTSQTLTY